MEQELKNLLEKSENILILVPEKIEGDVLTGALSLFFILKKNQENVNPVRSSRASGPEGTRDFVASATSNGVNPVRSKTPEASAVPLSAGRTSNGVNLYLPEIPKDLRFLIEENNLTPTDFLINIDTTKTKIKEIRYEKDEKSIKLHLVPEENCLKQENINVSPFTENFDLIITVGVKNLEELGTLYQRNKKVFFQTPILNIDNSINNQNFGAINFVKPHLSAVCEVVFELFELFSWEIDKQIASILLSGLILATENFQNEKTTPGILEKASQLSNISEADQKIIENFYPKTNLKQIKAIGRIFEKIKFFKEKELALIPLTRQDLQVIEEGDLSWTLKFIKSNFSLPRNLLILWESHSSENFIKGRLWSLNHTIVEKISKNYQVLSKPQGLFFFIKNKRIEEIENEILNIL